MRVKTMIKERTITASWIAALGCLFALPLFVLPDPLQVLFVLPAFFLLWIFHLDPLPRRHLAFITLSAWGLTAPLFLPDSVNPFINAFFLSFATPVISLSLVVSIARIRLPRATGILLAAVGGALAALALPLIAKRYEDRILFTFSAGILVGFIESFTVLFGEFRAKWKTWGIVAAFFSALGAAAAGAIGSAIVMGNIVSMEDPDTGKGGLLTVAGIAIAAGILMYDLFLKDRLAQSDRNRGGDPLLFRSFPAFASATALAAVLYAFLLKWFNGIHPPGSLGAMDKGLPLPVSLAASLGLTIMPFMAVAFNSLKNGLQSAAAAEKSKWDLISSPHSPYCLIHGRLLDKSRSMFFYADIRCPGGDPVCLKYSVTGAARVIGVIGGGIRSHQLEGETLYVALCDEKYVGRPFFVHSIEIRNAPGLDLERGVNAFIIAVQDSSWLPPGYLGKLRVSVKGDEEIPAATMNLIRNNFTSVEDSRTW
jgi:hypothetical protein